MALLSQAAVSEICSLLWQKEARQIVLLNKLKFESKKQSVCNKSQC
jgi:hypothetical protein